MSKNQGWVKAPVVAEHLGVSQSCVRKHVWKKTIPFLKIGGAVRFNLSEVEAHFRGDRPSCGG